MLRGDGEQTSRTEGVYRLSRIQETTVRVHFDILDQSSVRHKTTDTSVRITNLPTVKGQ